MTERRRPLLRRLSSAWPLLLCAGGAVSVALLYLVVTHQRAGVLGFPIDDAYIYLTYAKQIGRLEPMSYYPGGPYSAGSTSPLWPFVLAPLWAVGFRGLLFVYAAFAVSAALVATATVLAFRVVEAISDRRYAMIAAVATAGSGAFTYGALSAMEVGLAAAMLLWVALRLIRERDRERPSVTLLVLLALTSLTRPELTLLVAGFVGLRAVTNAFARRPRIALLWLSPVLLPLAWVTINKLTAGHLFPNTGVAKSHFYLPGFTWSYYADILPRLFSKMFAGLFWSAKSPLWHAKLSLLLSALGVAALIRWAIRERQGWAALVLASAPFALIAAVIGASGSWSFHNYRYIAACFPWLAALTALGAQLIASPLEKHAALRWPLRLFPFAFAILVAVLSWPDLYANVRYFAQGVRDTNDQVVKVGRFISEHLPADAHVAFHDAGAISYYGDRRGTDVLGLVSNGNAPHANQGPGTRFEWLERIPEAERPTHFAYYRGWLGTHEFFGETLLHTRLRASTYSGKPRLVGGGDMEVMVARWDAVGSGETPCASHPGWEIVDSVDVADLVSEAGHGYRSNLGARRLGDPTARWSDARTGRCGERSRISDGGRLARGPGGERFMVTVDPRKDARLIVRTGGADSHWSKAAPAGATLRVTVNGAAAGEIIVSGPTSALTDNVLEIPSALLGRANVEVRIESVPFAAYRSFHHFILQPRDQP